MLLVAKHEQLPINSVVCGDAFSVLPSFPKQSIDMIMFSPPYWGLRSYKNPKLPSVFAKGGMGLEEHPTQYIKRMVVLGRLLRRVLKKQGSMYINLGDTYFGGGRGQKISSHGKMIEGSFLSAVSAKETIPNKLISKWLQPKQLLGIPWRCAIALQHDGWILRNDIIWHKPNHMPSSVKDRLTTSYEHIFHFVKSRRYYYDLDAIRQPHKISSIKRLSQDLSKQHGGPKERMRREEDIILGGADLKLSSEILKRMKKKYESKFQESDYGQTLQGFIRTQSIAKSREQSRIEAKRLFPNDKKKQQEYIHYVHDHDGHPRDKNPADVIQFLEERASKGGMQREAYNAWKKWKEQNPNGKYEEFYEEMRRKKPRKPSTKYLGTSKESASENIQKYLSLPYPLGKNPSDFWSINTKPFPEAHFAVYPEEICRMPILSSCPAQICVECGKPRKRISKATYKPRGTKDKVRALEEERKGNRKIAVVARHHVGFTFHETVGWSDCGCGKGFEPGVVLDPMCGAGTTLIAAHKLGRRWIGIELNKEYVKMARERIERECSEWLEKWMPQN